MFGLAAVAGDGQLEGHHTGTRKQRIAPLRKTENEKRVVLESNFVFRYDAAKRKTVCCTVFRFLSYIRKTRIVCL